MIVGMSEMRIPKGGTPFPPLKCEPKASTQNKIKPQRHKVHRERLRLFLRKRGESSIRKWNIVISNSQIAIC